MASDKRGGGGCSKALEVQQVVVTFSTLPAPWKNLKICKMNFWLVATFPNFFLVKSTKHADEMPVNSAGYYLRITELPGSIICGRRKSTDVNFFTKWCYVTKMEGKFR